MELWSLPITDSQLNQIVSAVRPNMPGQEIPLTAKTNFRDYEPGSIARKKILPVLEDTMIHLQSLEMCQR